MRNLKNIQVGTKVRISDAVRGSFMANTAMNIWIGKVMTVRSIEDGGNYLRMEEDVCEHGGNGWAWYPSFIESIVFCDDDETEIDSEDVDLFLKIFFPVVA